MNEVELIGVSYSYGGAQVLRNISVSFPENKITAIIGRSGSGKSTLLQIVSGLLRPAGGQVKFAAGFSSTLETRRNTGIISQGIGLFPHLTVSQNMELPARIAGWEKEKRSLRITELLNLLGLPPDHSNKFPFELSGGEQQRVGIGRALFLNPRLLLMDEPFGALDPITRHEIQLEVLKLQGLAPRTILLVTHDMREARLMTDKILVLEKGEVQQFDDKDRVLTTPSNSYVKNLLDAAWP